MTLFYSTKMKKASVAFHTFPAWNPPQDEPTESSPDSAVRHINGAF